MSSGGSTKRRDYLETFDDGPGGWLGWKAGGGGPLRLEINDGAAITRSPWGVDFNHAPPGAGYLHLLYALLTPPREAYEQWVGPRYSPLAGPNRFVEGEFSRDFTDATMSVRLRGDLDTRGAELVLLIQAEVGPVTTNYVLTGQPLKVTPEFSRRELSLAPDPRQWTCLGTRGEGADNPRYGEAPIADALRNVNVDIILVLFPLDIRPLRPLTGDPHRLRAGKDYEVDRARLPEGFVEMDEIGIRYP